MSAILVVRTALYLCALVAVIASLATPILHRFDKSFNVNVGFYFFGESQWKVNSMPEDSRSKCIYSLYATIIGTVLLCSTLFTVRRFPIIAAITLGFTIFTFAGSVANMQVGVHFYNQSPGAFFAGTQYWGVGATLHTVCASILFIPLIAIIVAGCITRNRRKRLTTAAADESAAYGGGGPANYYGSTNYRQSAQPEKAAAGYGDYSASASAAATCRAPYAVLVVPIVFAIGLAVAGSGAPQASRMNDLGYRRSWHFIVVSSDFALSSLRDGLVCEDFYRKLVTGGALAVAAGSVNFLALLANLLLTRVPIVAAILVTLGCGLATGAAYLGTSLSATEIDCGDAWKNQGHLDIDYGMWSLFAGCSLSLVTAIVGFLTCSHKGSPADAQQRQDAERIEALLH